MEELTVGRSCSLRPVFHVPKAFCGTLGLCLADLRITSKMQAKSVMLFADWNVCGGFLYMEKSSFTELLNGIEFLEVFSCDLLET